MAQSFGWPDYLGVISVDEYFFGLNIDFEDVTIEVASHIH